MKDNLFELLISLFEKSLSQIQKNARPLSQDPLELLSQEELVGSEDEALFIQSAQQDSTRILTLEERVKLTKASYQFLMRMKIWGMLGDEFFEAIMNQVVLSESRMVTLEETKWAIRNALASRLNEKQLAFLDLVLYQSEDGYSLH